MLGLLRAAVLALTGSALVACTSPAANPTGLEGPYPVVRVVDGDTIRVERDGDEVVVRLIGIDTPETVAQDRPVECYGPEASERARELLDGSRVWLEYDPVSGETDRYGRALAYVWLDGDRMVNEVLVREGFAEEYTYAEGYRHQADLRDAEREARQADRGLWGACG